MSIKTVTLTGTEVAITGLNGSNAYVRNDGTETIYAAKAAGITPGADGVASIPAGQSGALRGIDGRIFLLGTGSTLVQSDDFTSSPFKTSTASGGSAVDDTARTAISTHSANTEIHVTAAEKTAWNAKADSAYVLKNNLYASGSDCNDCTEPGWYTFSGCGGHAPGSNSTINSGTYFILLNVPMPASGYFVQFATFVHGSANYLGRTYIRYCNNLVWSDWDELIRKSDFDTLEARVTALESNAS